MTALLGACSSPGLDFSSHPSTVLSNGEVEMHVFLPDTAKGLYRATRFDWSGVILSTTWQDHEYFGYWKNSHDPMYHEDLPGPVEGFHAAGLNYGEAQTGEGFVRIGVGVLEKPEEEKYNWMGTYKVLDYGTWTVQQGEDWITFTHRLETDFGYAYVYKKTIRLKEDGFSIGHVLVNTGEKAIETDQFNHNFFMIDGTESGPAFEVSFPFVPEILDSTDLYVIEGKSLFIPEAMGRRQEFVKLGGYSEEVADHEITVVNRESGAGVRFGIDRPLYDLGFWSCATTLCPENFIWLSVRPGQQEEWTSDYTFFLQK